MTPHHKFINDFCDAYELRHGFKYVFQAKDAAAAQKLLRNFEPAHLLRIIREAWKQPRIYPYTMADTLPKFLSHINEIRVSLNARRSQLKPKTERQKVLAATGRAEPAVERITTPKQVLENGYKDLWKILK